MRSQHPFHTLLLILTTCALGMLALPGAAAAAKEEEKDEGPWQSGTFSGLKIRSIGPALMSGRVGDFAVDPRNPYHYYVAVSSGNVWETHNAGTTWEPIFDGEGSYSIGCVTIDPTDPNVVWVGTGENNSQRSVSYGDGVYKSVDGGKNWKNMGLENSMHIGKIIVHPQDGNIVYVAAMGPLWGPGGDRGLYRTSDGGATWVPVLEIDEDTGVVDIAMDPRDPDVIYAASYQRRRHVWTLINGGPGSGIHKTTDGGATWQKLSKGLPGKDMGRIGLAIALKRPDTIYAIIESVGDAGGFFRSTDGGATWKSRNDYVASSPQYYHEIIADPIDPDRVYSLDTFLRVTEDGGKNFQRLSWRYKHVDDHAMWIDPQSTDHLLVGCDGGIYESFDRGEHWRYAANLPITQYYRIAVDYDLPFYNVYGGTQDNNTQGGPSRTISANGISNRDWFTTLGGDGFEPAIDPTDPNIVYCQWQHGNLARYDKRSGEKIDIKPQPEAGEVLRWNWDSALIISPHDHQRLYFACQRIYRSDDRGDSWTAISDDLSRNLDRNRMEVMGRVWGVDTVAKNRSTSFYGNVVALSESPLTEGVIYAGTDDGLIQVTRDGGETWSRHDKFKKVPELAYVSCLTASQHDEGTVFACFDAHKLDDLKPYVLRSDDHGKSWRDISGDLPERGTVYSLQQDHVDANLLFVGTEFGLFFTVDGGESWIQLKAGIPTIACRDLDIQRRENDVAIATFGRSFYILDDYTPLRGLSPEDLEQEAILFPVKDALLYVPSKDLGGRLKGSQGDAFYAVENPPFGAIVTYYLKDDLQSLEKMRQKAEKKQVKAEEPVYYPSWDELRAEDREHDPEIVLTVTDGAGKVVRRVTAKTSAGIHRVAWDLRYPAPNPIRLGGDSPRSPWASSPSGPLVVPGQYAVSLSRRVRGIETPLAGPVPVQVVPLDLNELRAADPAAALAFQQKAADLQRAVLGAARLADAAQTRIDHLRAAVIATPAAGTDLLNRLDFIETELLDLQVVLDGDDTVARRNEPTTPSLRGRVSRVVHGLNETTCAPTQTQRTNLAVAAKQFAPLLAELTELSEVKLTGIEDELEGLGAPYTPGRVPSWQK